MASTFTPSTPITGPWAIDREDCIGDSLGYLNANTNFFGVRVNSLSADLNTTRTTLSTVPYARLNDGNQSGSAPIFGARAWVNFDGTSYTLVGSENICAIRGSGNVSKVVRNSVGNYSVYFTQPMLNTDYCLQVTSNAAAFYGCIPVPQAYFTSYVQFFLGQANNYGAPIDSGVTNVVIFG